MSQTTSNIELILLTTNYDKTELALCLAHYILRVSDIALHK